MFPVLSLLRRFASAQIFVRKDQLEVQDKRYWVRLNRPSSVLDLVSGTWGPALPLLPMSMLQVVSPSSEAAAASLVRRENVLAEQIRATQVCYTLVLGPEDEETRDEKVVRTSRLCVVLGVFRATPPVMEPAPPRGKPLGKHFPLPKGSKISGF